MRLKRFYGTEQGDHSCKQAYTEQEVPPKPALQNQGTPNNKNCFAGRVFFLLGRGGGASFIIRGKGLRSSAALASGCCLSHILDHPRSQQPQIQEWLQKHGELLGCCCLRRTLQHPSSQQLQIQEWRQKQQQLRECAGRSSAVLAHGCCLRCSVAQVTTAPDSRMAAQVRPVACTRSTFLNFSCTWLLSPPYSGSVQVTTAPDSRMAAKAPTPGAWMH